MQESPKIFRFYDSDKSTFFEAESEHQDNITKIHAQVKEMYNLKEDKDKRHSFAERWK